MAATAEWMNKAKPYVNSALLADNRYFNKIVCLIGRVNEGAVDPIGTQVKVQTSDHGSITVRLQQPLSEPLTNVVTFVGRVGRAGRELECLNYVPIKEEVSENFDFDAYNRMVEFLHKISAETATAGNGF